MPGATTSLIGRHRDPQTPASVRGEATQQQRDHVALEAHRGDIADLARQTALALPQLRRAHKQHEVAPHQP